MTPTSLARSLSALSPNSDCFCLSLFNRLETWSLKISYYSYYNLRIWSLWDHNECFRHESIVSILDKRLWFLSLSLRRQALGPSDTYNTQKWKHFRSFEVIMGLVEFHRISWRCSLTFHLEIKMPWRQTSSYMKKAVVFITVTMSMWNIKFAA